MMMLGIVAGNRGRQTGGGLPTLASANFLTGVYSVGGSPVTAADVVDQPELIGASGLAVPSADDVVGIIGGFLTVLAAADWTLVLEYEDSGESGTCFVLAITSASPSWDDFIQIQRRSSGSGRVMEAYDEDGDARFVQDADSHGAGVHKIALTRTNERCVMSVDGDAVEADETGNFSLSLTSAAFGGLPDDFTNSGCNIRKLDVYATQDDSLLPVLSA